MKWGLRRPSIRQRIAARTSLKRAIRHRLGLKVPRGWGWLTNPRKAAYNRLYRRTTFGLGDLFKPRRRRQPSAGCLLVLLMVITTMTSIGGLIVICVTATTKV
jgi:hypothetical protein